MSQRRTVFFVSDGTGITAQMLGHSLLTQFEGVDFNQVTLPFVDSAERAQECLARIEAESASGNGQAIVFSTLVNQDLRQVVRRANALFLDFFETFIDPLEAGLGVKASHTIGRSHSAMDKKEYQQRIEAINFAMAHDDGASHRELGQADVILIGVSRSGKTPTSLYLALQFGVKAANYPLIPEDFQRMKLPEALRAHKGRLYGLTIASERLHEIRQERRADPLPLGAEDPPQAATEIGLAQRHPAAGDGADGDAFKSLYFRAEVTRNAQIQPEMTSHAGAQHLGRPGVRAAAVEHDLADTEGRRGAQDRTHVARVLDAFEEHAWGDGSCPDVGNRDLGGDPRRALGVGDGSKHALRQDHRLYFSLDHQGRVALQAVRGGKDA